MYTLITMFLSDYMFNLKFTVYIRVYYIFVKRRNNVRYKINLSRDEFILGVGDCIYPVIITHQLYSNTITVI